MRKTFFALLLIAVSLSGCVNSAGNSNQGNNPSDGEPIANDNNAIETPDANIVSDNNAEVLLIANWNLQVFGTTKASKPELLEYYAGKIRAYDIVTVQEIRDSSGTAFPKLCDLLPEYTCIVSSRAGTTSSKEQYGIIYRNAEFLGSRDWNDANHSSDFERPPFEATFRKGDWTFTIVTIHAKPEDVARELENLEKLLNAREAGDEIIILGDLNADCNYYSEDENKLSTWIWAIPSTEDTTVAQTNCAYDRIIFTPRVKDNYQNYGVMRDVINGQSDHYLVYGEFAS